MPKFLPRRSAINFTRLNDRSIYSIHSRRINQNLTAEADPNGKKCDQYKSQAAAAGNEGIVYFHLEQVA